jgi:excisionase family DNA binding protein
MTGEGRILYRPNEAAAALGVSRARLYQLLGSGEIASVKLGSLRRIPAADLETYVARLRSEAGLPSEANRPTAAIAS